MSTLTLLGITEVARTLDCSHTYARYLADTGRIPCTRDSGGKRLFFAQDIEAFRQQREAAKHKTKPSLRLNLKRKR